MPQNLEIKLRVPSLAIPRRRLAEFARHIRTVRQRDTYFSLGPIRLKLREEAGHAELIVYARPNQSRSRASDYEAVPVRRPHLWRRALRPAQVVTKSRELWRWRGSRIHLDRVQGLGTFLEIETEISRGADPQELGRILSRLGLSTRQGLPGSYSDLVRARTRSFRPVPAKSRKKHP
jgi:adenylate cyclase class IV